MPTAAALASARSDPRGNVIARFWPRPAAFLAGYPRMLKAIGGEKLENSACFASADFSVAALWLRPGAEAAPGTPIPSQEASACGAPNLERDPHGGSLGRRPPAARPTGRNCRWLSPRRTSTCRAGA